MSEELELDKAINKIKYTFRLTGMNTLVDSNRRKYRDHVKHRMRYYIFNISSVTDLVLGVIWLVQGVSNEEDFTDLTYIAPCLAVLCLSVAKSIYFVINDDQVNELITLLRELEKKNERTLVKDEIINQETTFLNTILTVMKFFNCSLMIIFPLMPLCYIAGKYFTTNEIDLILPFDVYPFNARDIRYWPFVYARQLLQDATVMMQICGADYLFYIYTTFIKIQLLLLQCDIQEIISENFCRRELVKEMDIHSNLVNLLKWHSKIIDSVNLLEIIYSKSMLFNFLCSSLLICLCVFNMTMIDNVPFVVSCISFLIMSLLQIFTLCYFSDLLMSSSMKVSDAVYNCKWYLADAVVGKHLNIMQIRARKPCKITAYGFADVNLAAFTKILSTSWSYFALLRTVYDSSR